MGASRISVLKTDELLVYKTGPTEESLQGIARLLVIDRLKSGIAEIENQRCQHSPSSLHVG